MRDTLRGTGWKWVTGGKLGKTVLSIGLAAGLSGCAPESAESSISQALSSDPDQVLAWNAIGVQTIVGPGGANKPPMTGMIDLSMVHVAIYDAVNAIEGYPYTNYASRPNVTAPASANAAAAVAGHDVLVALYPAKAAALDALLASALAAIHDPADEVSNGSAVGQQTAAAIVALRANDGRNNVSGYTPGSGLGAWVPTPPGFLPAATPWVRNVTPWAMSSPSQLRPEPPAALDSEDWVNNYNEVKALGPAVGSTRTAEQTDIARFWTEQPMLQWNRAARQIAVGHRLSLEDNARFFALQAMSSSEALIACWDAKFAYAFWRPVTAIRAGGGNAALSADASWIGSVVTPNHPEYPAAHGCNSGAIAETLKTFFGTDKVTFTLDSTNTAVTNKVRTYTSFSAVVDEMKEARIYGGMHYRMSVNAGSIVGKQVSHLISNHYFKPTHGRGKQHFLVGDANDGAGTEVDEQNSL